MRWILFVLVVVIALAGLVAYIVPASGQADKRTRDDLAGKLDRREVQHSLLSIPGREMVQVETLIPAGLESGWHIHPGEEVGYIIGGQVEMRVQGRATVSLNPGDGFLIPPQTPREVIACRRFSCPARGANYAPEAYATQFATTVNYRTDPNGVKIRRFWGT